MAKRMYQLIAICLSCGLFFLSVEAWACGGCFSPPNSAAPVTGHRMAFAVSETRTVLWDQFQYSGAPEDFSWVLPVRPGAYLEPSTDAWFDALESVTQTRVYAPQLNCASSSSGGGCACGGMAAESDNAARGASNANGPGVTVLHQGTVGPYETVTLRSTNGDALTTWLTNSGYVIPPDITPIIAAYVSEGADFIALRLKPGVGVQQMTPVRVITPGGKYLLPLRMVAAGVGEFVDIVLYVIGEQRYAMSDLHPVSVNPQHVVWDFAINDSNYLELRRQALARDLSFTYLTSFADQRAFSARYSDPLGTPVNYQVGSGFRRFSTLADVYFAQALVNDNLSPDGCPSIETELSSNELVVEKADSGGLPASNFTCKQYTDIAAAMIGLHPARHWLSRMELKLPREALSMDCILNPDASQLTVSHLIQAVQSKNRPDGCEQPIFESRLAAGRLGPKAVWLTVFAACILALLRRRRGGAQ